MQTAAPLVVLKVLVEVVEDHQEEVPKDLVVLRGAEALLEEALQELRAPDRLFAATTSSTPASNVNPTLPAPKVRNASPVPAEHKATTAGTMKSPLPSSVMMGIAIPIPHRTPAVERVFPPSVVTGSETAAKGVILGSMLAARQIVALSHLSQVHLLRH